MILDLTNRCTITTNDKIVTLKPLTKSDAIWLCIHNEVLDADEIDMTEFRLGKMPLIRRT